MNEILEIVEWLQSVVAMKTFQILIICFTVISVCIFQYKRDVQVAQINANASIEVTKIQSKEFLRYEVDRASGPQPSYLDPGLRRDEREVKDESTK